MQKKTKTICMQKSIINFESDVMGQVNGVEPYFGIKMVMFW